MADQDSQCNKNQEAPCTADLSEIQLYGPRVVATPPYMVDTALVTPGL